MQESALTGILAAALEKLLETDRLPALVLTQSKTDVFRRATDARSIGRMPLAPARHRHRAAELCLADAWILGRRILARYNCISVSNSSLAVLITLALA
jgi:hypothetical protein